MTGVTQHGNGLRLMGNSVDIRLKNTMTHSAECLRKAVPLMVKYNIAVTPANYALWYSYVSGNHPNLNAKLDAALQTYGTCPPALSRDLFEEFLSDKDLDLFDSVAENISNLVEQVQSDMGQTLSTTCDFSQVLDSCNQDLDRYSKQQSHDIDVLDLVNKLAEESKLMQQTAERFQNKLSTAYHEISRLREELKQSQQAATKDALTGLNNRGAFDEDIELLCSSHHSALKLFLTFVDIDHFKQFNDDFGHQKGDQVLQVVAKRLLKNADQLNTAYRYGGEEFCILSQFKDVETAVNYAEKIRAEIERLAVKDGKSGQSLRNITASFGIAQYAGSSCSELVENADKALYEAKESGRNRVVVYKSFG